MRRLASWAAGLAVALALHGPAGATERIFSLDQCADQFVLGLADRDAIVGLSRRVDDRDSYLSALAPGLPMRRPTLESILAARPTLVVRYWGGDPRLVRTLRARGVRVAEIAEANDFEGVRRNVRTIAAALGRAQAGEAMVGEMNRELAAARGAWRGQSALYLTSGGYTAGPGTLVDAIMRAAGLVNAVRAPGFSTAPLEALVLAPPQRLVLGFFDNRTVAIQRWGPGRHQVVRRLLKDRTATRLSSRVMGCPGWFSTNAVRRLANAGRR
jgi:iron complex transport system substrate-binding protein